MRTRERRAGCRISVAQARTALSRRSLIKIGILLCCGRRPVIRSNKIKLFAAATSVHARRLGPACMGKEPTRAPCVRHARGVYNTTQGSGKWTRALLCCASSSLSTIS